MGELCVYTETLKTCWEWPRWGEAESVVFLVIIKGVVPSNVQWFEVSVVRPKLVSDSTTNACMRSYHTYTIVLIDGVFTLIHII